MNKIAFITGGSKGIGLATAKALSEAGCYVVICSRSAENLKKANAELIGLGLGYIDCIKCDVLKEAEVKRAIYQFKDQVNILINNVGGGGRWGTEIPWKTPDSVWSEVYTKNVGAAIKFTNGFLPNMIQNHWGRVVTISSIYGKEAGGRPWFNIAKSAEISLMKAFSRNKAAVRNGVTFNTICPGHISVEGKPDEINLEDFPLGRMGKPEEIANVAVFLCSEKASLVNGACITVDGGESHSF